MDSFREQIAGLLSAELKMPKEQVYSLIETPPEGMGDYAFPCFGLAKELHKAPNQIAIELAARIKHSALISRIEPKGAYINFFINPLEMASSCIKQVIKEKQCYGTKAIQNKTILIESPGPNTNKPLHLGHIRNMVLGSSLCLINEALGNKVFKVDIINDRGVHICKSMLAYKLYANGASPDKKPDHFVGDYYVLYSKNEPEHPEFADSIRELLVKWEQSDPETKALWKKMRDWAVEGMAETYKRFSVRIDKPYYESDHYLGGRQICLDGLDSGIFQKDDEGNVIVDLPGIGKKVILRADGTSIYITQDMVLAKIRYDDYKMDKMVYVVGSEQILHFQILFRIFELLKYPFAKDCYHLAYGMVYLPEGKMKSREGTVVDADNLADEMHAMALAAIKERHGISDDERAEKIAMASIKFFVLKFDPLRDFVYDPKESMSFEGETGPYLQYTYARIASILRKHGKPLTEDVDWNLLSKDDEYKMAKMLYQYPTILESAGQEYKPSLICRYLLDLSQAFNEFYHKCPVLTEKPAVRDARLLLIKAVQQVLANGLGMLGIETLEEM